MGFRNNAYAKVWEVKPSDRYTDARISISRKRDGEYVTDFTGYVRLIGDAHGKAATLEEGDRIQITSCDVSNNYVKEKNITYYTCKVFDFEFCDGGKGAAPTETGFLNVEEDAELPFG